MQNHEQTKSVRARGRRAQNRWARVSVWAMLFGFLLLAPLADALDNQKHLTQYVLSKWQAERGLPQNTVTSIARTPDGYLWVGTQEGLARFDGMQFTVFSHTNTPQLEGGDVLTLVTDSSGRLWIGTGDGLVLYQNGTFRRLRDGAIETLIQDHSGAIWVGSNAGVERISAALDRSTVYTAAEGLLDQKIVAVYEDRSGTIWLSGQHEGLERWESGRFVRFALDSDAASSLVTAIAEDERGALWMGTRDGRLYQLASGHIRQVNLSAAEHGAISALLTDREDTLYIGTTGGGLFRLRGDSIEQMTTDAGLPSGELHAFYKDSDGSLWIGTGSGGLARLRDGKFTPFGAPEGLIGNSAWAVTELTDGSLLIGTDRGLSRYRDSHFEYLSQQYGLGHNTVRAILQTHDGAIWFGVDSLGLYRLHGGRLTHYRASDELTDPIERIYAIYEDSARRLWVGTRSKLYRMEGETLVPEKALQSLGAVHYYRIVEDPSGRILLGTDIKGVLALDHGRVQSYGKGDGLPSLLAGALYVDEQGAAWVGTAAGLARIYKGRVAARELPGPLQKEVLGIFEDRQHQLWLATNKGVFSVARSEMDRYFNGDRLTPRVREYDVQDGMRDSEFNGGNNSAGCVTRDGKLWLVSIRGLVEVDPAHIPVNSTPPPVVVERIVGDGKVLGPASGLIVPPGVEKWEFDYTALSLRMADRQRFKYKLDGYDRNWVDAGSRRAAYYTRLPPGAYTFHVVASNEDGIWNARGASLPFRFQPYFYQTNLFYALCIAVVAILVFLAHRLRVRHLRGRAAQMEALIKERTADLAKAREDLLDASRMAGRADIATSVLHNVGNVLNSVGVSASLASAQARKLSFTGLHRLVTVLQQEGLHAFVASERGQHLPDYLANVSTQLTLEQESIIKELANLSTHVEHIGEIVAMQQAHATRIGLAQEVRMTQLVEDVLRLAAASFDSQGIELVTEVEEFDPIVVDKHRVLQILVNLIRNAGHACVESQRRDKCVTVRVARTPEAVTISVIDNGVGIAPENLTRIFTYGFTTRPSGHGFGLHSGALAAKEIGGSLSVQSDGLGRGATFTLNIPVS